MIKLEFFSDQLPRHEARQGSVMGGCDDIDLGDSNEEYIFAFLSS